MHTTPPKLTDQDICDRIYGAILGRRLRPGARLVEEELARLFEVSRTKVRHAIAKLAQDGIVRVRRNHGATVAAPTRAETRQVMEFRYMLEPPVAGALARTMPESSAAMRGHIAEEFAARAAGNNAALVRLTGEFHLRLAELHGNALVLRALREAEALTCLSILSYGRPNAAACLPDEHERILAAIADGDEATASAVMLRHLRHVADEMDLSGAEPHGLASALDMEAPTAA